MLTEPEYLRAWFPATIEVERWEVGAPLRFVLATGDAFDGEVLAVEPPSLLALRSGTDALRLELEPAGAGTILTLLDTIDTLGEAARDGAGWHVCLDRLEHDLDGTTPPWSTSERGRELPTGPPEGGPVVAQVSRSSGD